jgi:hypothetical protein
MDEDDPHDDIEALEARIEELAASIENCRKIMLLSRLGIAAGGFALVAYALGWLGSNPIGLLAGIVGVLGGTVLLGSNSSTANQAAQALREAEAQRAALIGQIGLRVVGGTDTVH